MNKRSFLYHWRKRPASLRYAIGYAAWLQVLERMALRNHGTAWLEPEDKLLCGVLAQVFEDEELQAPKERRKAFARRVEWFDSEACAAIAGAVGLNAATLHQLSEHGRQVHEWIS